MRFETLDARNEFAIQRQAIVDLGRPLLARGGAPSGNVGRRSELGVEVGSRWSSGVLNLVGDRRKTVRNCGIQSPKSGGEHLGKCRHEGALVSEGKLRQEYRLGVRCRELQPVACSQAIRL